MSILNDITFLQSLKRSTDTLHAMGQSKLVGMWIKILAGFKLVRHFLLLALLLLLLWQLLFSFTTPSILGSARRRRFAGTRNTWIIQTIEFEFELRELDENDWDLERVVVEACLGDSYLILFLSRLGGGGVLPPRPTPRPTQPQISMWANAISTPM